jgi:hypothetical protein
MLEESDDLTAAAALRCSTKRQIDVKLTNDDSDNSKNERRKTKSEAKDRKVGA